MKGSAVVNSKHSENLPPHQKRNQRHRFLRKDYFKQSYGWEPLHLLPGNKPLGFSQLTFPSLSWGQTWSDGVK